MKPRAEQETAYFLPGIVDDVAVLILSRVSDEQLLLAAKVNRSWYRLSSKVAQNRYIQHFQQQPSVQNVRLQYHALLAEEVKAIHAIFCQDILKHRYDVEIENPREFYESVKQFSTGSVQRLKEVFKIPEDVFIKARSLIDQMMRALIQLPEKTITQDHINQLLLLAQRLKKDHTYEAAQEDVATFNLLFIGNSLTSNKDRVKFIDLFTSSFYRMSSAGLSGIIKLLVAKHPDLPKLKFIRGYGASMLHGAVEGMQYDLARYLISVGADVNGATAIIDAGSTCRDISTSSPLLETLQNLSENLTAEQNQATAEFIRDLLNAGADPMQICDNHATDTETTPFFELLAIRQNTKLKAPLTLFENKLAWKSYPQLILPLLQVFKDKVAATVTSRCSIV